MYLLDTCICFEYIRGSQAVIDRVTPNLDRCRIPAMVYGELCAAKYYLSSPNNQEVLQGFLKSFKNRVLKFDQMAAEEFGRISRELREKGKEQNFEEMRLAALARCHSATIVTDEDRAQKLKAIKVKFTTSWLKSDTKLEILFPKITDEPGIVYRVATILAASQINIEEASATVTADDNLLKFSRLYCQSDLNINNLISKIKNETGFSEPRVIFNGGNPSINSEIIESNARFAIKIELDSPKRDEPVIPFLITGVDRPGLVADIARLTFNQNLNIIRFSSTTSYRKPLTDNGLNFEIRFSFYDNREVDWDSLKSDIKSIEGVSCITTI